MIGLTGALARLEDLRAELDALAIRAQFETANGVVELEVVEGGRGVIVHGERIEVTP